MERERRWRETERERDVSACLDDRKYVHARRCMCSEGETETETDRQTHFLYREKESGGGRETERQREEDKETERQTEIERERASTGERHKHTQSVPHIFTTERNLRRGLLRLATVCSVQPPQASSQK